MRSRTIARRAGLWAGLGIALGLGIILVTGTLRDARATEGPESKSQADETVATARALVTRLEAGQHSPEDVATARALVAQLEARQHAIESSLQKARELLARLEGKGTPEQPGQARVANMRNANGSDLEGVWRLIGVRSQAGEPFQTPPYNLFKIMTADHFLWSSFDPHTGRATRWCGGSYWLKDGTYTGRIEFSNSEDMRALIGKEYQFACKVGGDRWEHTGTLPNGVKVDDLWVRIDPHP